MNHPPSSILHPPTNRADSQKPLRPGENRLRWTWLGILLGGIPWLVGCSGDHPSRIAPATDLPPVSVRVETIHPIQLPFLEEVVGTVRSRQAADIAAKISGRILELPVALGQTVEEGALLVAMDSREIQARLEQSKVNLRQAEIDFRRVETLLQTGAATPSESDTATSRFHGAQAAVAEAEALLSHARITAPLSGVVARKDVDLGDLAMPGQLLLRIEDPEHLRLEADVPGSLLDRVHLNATLSVRVDGIDAPLEGRVTEMAPVADPATRSSRVKLDLPPTPGLRAGQFGRVDIPLGDDELLVVPSQALLSRGQLDLLFVAADGKARMRIVRTGRTLAEGIEILAGLEAGESIVLEPGSGLVDGQPLSPR